MNVTCIRTGNGYTVLDAHRDIVGFLILIDDKYKVEDTKSLKMASEGVTERHRLLDTKLQQRYSKRNELRRRAKGSDPPK